MEQARGTKRCSGSQCDRSSASFHKISGTHDRFIGNGNIDKRASELPFPSPHDVVARLTDFVWYTVVTPRDADVATAAVSTLLFCSGKAGPSASLSTPSSTATPARVCTPIARHAATGQDVEIQFHSERGIAVQDAHHIDYELVRDAAQPRPDRSAAFEKMVGAWSQVATPVGLADPEVKSRALVRASVRLLARLYSASTSAKAHSRVSAV